MSSKECEEQLDSLIEHFNNGGLDLNATDIKAIKHLLLENMMQHDRINCLRKQLQQRDEVIEKVINRCELEISASSLQYERSHKQQDWVYKVAHERVLDILNKYKQGDSEQ